MMSVERAFEQLRRANPAPNPAALRQELQADADPTTDARSISMDMSTTTKSPAPPKKPRRWTPAVVAAAVVLLVAVPSVAWLAGSQPATPVEIAEDYLDARNAYDVDRARELVSEDFRTNEPPDGFVNAETMELAFQQHEAYGFHYSDIECTQEGDIPEQISVACEFLWTNEVQRVGNYPPTPQVFGFVTEDGRITRVSRSGPGNFPWWNLWQEFLAAEDPEFRMVVNRALDLDPESVRRLTEEMPRYLDLYEEWLNSQED